MNVRFAGRAFYPDYQATLADPSITHDDTILVSERTVALNDQQARHRSTFDHLQRRVEEAMQEIGRLPIGMDEYIQRDVQLRKARTQLWNDFTDPAKLVDRTELERYSRDFLDKDVFRQLNA